MPSWFILNVSVSSNLFHDMFFFSTSGLSISDTSDEDVETREVIVGIVTDIDLLHHVTKKEEFAGSSRSHSEGDDL